MGSRTLNPDSEAKIIVLDRHSALIDETIAIRIECLSPRQPVTITATQTLYDASRWQAQAIFVGDHSGCVDVAHQTRPSSFARSRASKRPAPAEPGSH